jgi:hypothetical protein
MRVAMCNVINGLSRVLRIGLWVALFWVCTGTTWVLAQSREVEDQIEQLKQRSDVIYVQVESEISKQDALQQANLKLKREILQKYGRKVQMGSGSMDDLELKVQLQKVPVESKTFYWDRRRSFHIFAYVTQEAAQQYVIDRTTFVYRDPDKYTFANATHPDAETALNQARSNLITQFQVTVQSEQTSVISEVNGEIDDRFKSQTRAFSKMSLNGLKTLTFDVGDQTYAFAYISHEDKEASFSTAKNRVLSLVEEGERQWEWGNYSRAINNYYRAYILSDAYYQSIPYEFKDGTTTKDLQETLRLKVEGFFQTMDVEMHPAYEIAEQDIVAPFKIKKGEDLVNKITYKYDVQGYNNVGAINYGKGKLEFTNYYPNERVEVFPVQFGVDITQEVESDPVLQELAPARKFFVERPVRVDFSNVFKVTIEAYFDGVDITYSVHTRNLVATTAKWEFGDGETTVGLNPTHQYNELKIFPVSVVVNGDPALTDTKYIDLEQGILRNNPPKPLLASAAQQDVAVRTESAAEVPQDSTADISSSDPTADSTMASPEEEESNVAADTSKTVADNSDQNVETKAVVPEVKQETYKDHMTNKLAKIAEYRSMQGLLVTLKRMKKEGQIEYGKQTDLFDSEGALVIIADRRKVYDHLIFMNNRYIRTDTGEEMVDLSKRYSGKFQIWVKETE